jgi:hypothetical protein
MTLAKLMSCAALALVMSGAAALGDEAPMRQLGAHVHGAAELDVAVDAGSGAALVVLSGAAYNFFGFERAPASDEERAAIDAAYAAFELAPVAFPAAAACTLTTVDIEAKRGGHGHSHGHNHGHNHDHGHGDDERYAGASDLVISWGFACENAARVTQLDASGVFETFGRIERLQASFASGNRAGARALTASSAVIAP